jgi:hypothetical protein
MPAHNERMKTMRTIEVTLYQYDELSEPAQQKARDWYREIYSFDGSDEIESVRTFCNKFGVNLLDFEIGAYNPFHYKTDAENTHFRGLKLSQFTADEMPTGYWLDCELWGAFYREFKKTGDARGAFDAALWAGFKAWRDDLEYQLSDESIAETLTLNQYEFTADGRRVK